MSNSSAPEPSTERVTRSTTARNPRRRARQSDQDTLKTQAPRRKRSKITDDTYAPRTSTENGSVAPSQESEVVEVEATSSGMGMEMNGHVRSHSQSQYTNGLSRHERTTSTGTGTPMMDTETPLAIRGGKKGTVKRSHLRGDGATTLCHNEVYSVKMLPSTPKELKKDGLEYRGSMQGHHALAVTQDKAIIWDYTSHAIASNPRTFSPDQIFPARSGDPLPFGALVPSGISTTDLGLVLISATTGKAIFYESIDRAASLGLFHDRKSDVVGTIPLSSYETITNVVSADHAGFVVALSSGKLVHLTLRDSQGKPRIANQQLKINEPVSGGVFGSFAGLLKSTYRRDLSAVHTRPSNVRGRMQAVGLTERAELLLWDLDWSGQSDFKANIDFRELLVTELSNMLPPEQSGQAEHAIALDFAITAKPSSGVEIAKPGDADQPLCLVILVRFGTADMHNYCLVELNLPGVGAIELDRIYLVKSYHASSAASSKPRLVLPRPGHTAFIAFEDATTLVGIPGNSIETPEAQLHASYVQPEAFEETVTLREDKNLAIQNIFDEQPKVGQASIVTFIKSAGLVRISAIDTATIPRFHRVLVKSKIEQAVFYGSLQQDNIIDFTKQNESGYNLEDIETAALDISDQILRAETAFTHFIPPSPSSMPQHLAIKAKALQALATHVRRAHPALSRNTMWRLLWDAERIAAGQQLWLAFQDHITLVSQVKRKSTLLDELCAWFEPQKETFALRKDLANEDDVRKFFIGGLHHLEKLLKNLRLVLKAELDETERTPAELVKLVLQANEICLLSLQTAYKFRTEHCASYGINPELMEDGILIAPDEYLDVGEFWTSAQWLVRNTVEVATLSGEINKNLYDPEALDVDTERMAREVAETNPQLLEIWCTQYQESINWHFGQPDPKQQELAKKLSREFEVDRYKQLRRLADVGQANAGMQLAEKYRDMNTLTDMVIAEDQYLEEMIHSREIDRSGIPAAKRELQTKIRQYFNRYGELWSNEFFDKLFSGASSGSKLARAQAEWKKPLAEYLRAHPSRAKLCWINDVTETSDFAHAASVLRHAAEHQETKLWSKKVELSMSKLALLAAEETEGPTAIARLPSNAQEKAASTQNDLAIVRVQEQLYAHIRPDIMASIDREAELQICMQNYSGKINEFGAFRQLLEQGLDLVLDADALSVEQLIDVLTLMNIKIDDSNEDNFMGAEFFKALTVLNAAAPSLPSTRFEMLLQVIWKRAYLYDNWNKIKFTSRTTDEERQAHIRRTVAWQTMHYFFESELANDPDAHVRIVLPSECLGSACAAEDWAYRFEDEDLLIPLVHDSQRQDETLQSYVVDRSLDEVAKECVQDVKTLGLKKRAEDKAMAEQESHLKESFGADEHTNGHPIGFEDVEGDLGPAEESGIEEEDDDGDDLIVGGDEEFEIEVREDGDVEMDDSMDG